MQAFHLNLTPTSVDSIRRPGNKVLRYTWYQVLRERVLVAAEIPLAARRGDSISIATPQGELIGDQPPTLRIEFRPLGGNGGSTEPIAYQLFEAESNDALSTGILGELQDGYWVFESPEGANCGRFRIDNLGPEFIFQIFLVSGDTQAKTTWFVDPQMNVDPPDLPPVDEWLERRR